MGGYGSGRWGYHTKADTVEDCLILDTADLSRRGTLQAQLLTSGYCHWTYASGKQCSIGYEIDTDDTTGRARLFYTATVRGEAAAMDYRQGLEAVPRHFGGVQWYFVCQLTGNGRYCGRRARKLYLPPGGRYFGCRQCYRLTYTSCQESHKHDGLWRLLARSTGRDAEDVKRLMEGAYRL